MGLRPPSTHGAALPPIDELDEKAATREGSMTQFVPTGECLVLRHFSPLTSVAATVRTQPSNPRAGNREPGVLERSCGVSVHGNLRKSCLPAPFLPYEAATFGEWSGRCVGVRDGSTLQFRHALPRTTERECPMRGDVVALLALSVSLAGCSGLPPKELPPWAMTRSSEQGYTSRTHVVRTRATRPESEHTYVAPTNAQSDDVKPFSPEWKAREDAFDNKLRRTMNICRGC